MAAVGFWVDGAGNNFGFYRSNNQFHSVSFPSADTANPQVDQLLGVNDRKIAVGFYTDSKGNNHGYIYKIGSHRFARVDVPGSSSVTATAINNLGDIAGFDTYSSGTVESFLHQDGGRMITLIFPGQRHASIRRQRSRRGGGRLHAGHRQHRHEARLRLGTEARVPQRR